MWQRQGAFAQGVLYPQTDGRDTYLVATTPGSIYIRLVGLCTMNNCTPLQEFLEAQALKGGREFIFDFSTARGFDSTFMGILIGFSLGERAFEDEAWGSANTDEAGAQRERCRVILVNLSPEFRKLLASVGVDRVVEFCDLKQAAPDIKLTRLKGSAVSADQRLARVVKAHEHLVQLDKRNEQKFGLFLEMVKKELEAQG